ncbi:MAG: 2OG-Fe(II) oxygenase [Kofleriaceae bacterium]
MWQLGPVWHDEVALAAAWRAASPFPHLVFDDFVPAARLDELVAMLEEEPVDPYGRDLFAFEASAPEPRSPELRALRESFAALLAAPLARIVGRPLARADMRAYAYRPGHYLLPHTDHRDGVGRAVAYAYYLPSPEPPTGGELELFRCEARGGELVAIEHGRLVEPRANRLVVFDVADHSLHQVCEVTRGLRISLAGWFYP